MATKSLDQAGLLSILQRSQEEAFKAKDELVKAKEEVVKAKDEAFKAKDEAQLAKDVSMNFRQLAEKRVARIMKLNGPMNMRRVMGAPHLACLI